MTPFTTIRLHYLDMLSSGETQFMVDIMDTFLVHFPGMLAAVQQAVDENDWQGLKYAAHKAKSPAKFLGLDEAWQMLHDLEEHAREQTEVPTYAPAYLQRLQTTANLAMQEVSAAKSHLQAGGTL